jgi:DNA (cytosine-5)-methyltransferase 1
MNNRTGKIDFEDNSSHSQLLAAEVNQEHDELVQAELNAIISHWLQCPDIPPIILGENYHKKWLEIIGGHPNRELVFKDVQFPPLAEPKFKFIDLFAGVGGFRMAMQQLGGKCVFSSEWEKFAKETYYGNYGEVPFGDITQINESSIPDHDILCGGFPCQAFSIAGRKGGFDDSRGTLFFDVARIIKEKQPKAFFLENVRGLKSHERGKTLATILNVLRNDLGYYVPAPEVMRAQDFGLPQKRGRVFIVGFHPSTGVGDFEYPMPFDRIGKLSDIKETGGVSAKYYVSTVSLASMKAHKLRHASKGNGFGYEIIPDDGIANTIVIGGMGKERNLVIDHSLKDFTPVTKIKGEVNREGIRKMIPREWARLQGFPDAYKIHQSNAQAYKQFGNSVAVPAIQATAEKILDALANPKRKPIEQQRLDFTSA